MARRGKKHEEHMNHEAWAIPYGDLITLLLAFFVVMYAISSLNEGKYRALSDSLAAAFAGSPRSLKPIEIGERQQGRNDGPPGVSLKTRPIDTRPPTRHGEVIATAERDIERFEPPQAESRPLPIDLGGGAAAELERVADEIEQAMEDMIERDLIKVRRTRLWVEVEIKTDMLFPSGVAAIAADALPVMEDLAHVLAPFPNSIRVEGHTDNVPIHTVAFRSNWELSAARAASVVHLFQQQGLEPGRLAVLGLGEHHPAASNDTPDGRNRNRRVVLVVMAEGLAPDRRVVNGSNAGGEELDANLPAVAKETAPEPETPEHQPSGETAP